MTGELELVQPSTGELVEVHDTDSWVAVVADIARLAEHVATTEFVPRGLRNNVPATTAAILYGRELGLPPMTALSQIAVIEGRPGLSAEGMRALVLAAGHEIEVVKSTSAECVMRGRRRGSSSWSEPVVWNGDNVRAAGLGHKDPWKRYPRAMLVARATTELCRNVFPDVIHGFRSVEEIGDMGDELEVEAPAPRSTTKVARKPRKTAKTAAGETAATAPASPAAPIPDDEPPPPPLPTDELEPVAPPLSVEDMPREEDPRPRARGRYADDDDPMPDELQPHGTGRPRRFADRVETTVDTPEAIEARLKAELVQTVVVHWGRMGLNAGDERAERLMLTGRIVGREISSTNELTVDELEYVVATLRVVKNLDDLRRILDVVEETAHPEEGSNDTDRT